MQFGLSVIVRGADANPDGFAQIGECAERTGWDCLWVSDHLVIPPQTTTRYPGRADGRFPDAWKQNYYQPFSVLNFLAARTRRVRLGTSVLILPMRNPLEVAAQVAQMDQLSGGRVNFGVGVGWFREEFEALGYDFASRGRRTDDGLEILRTLWREDKATHASPWYRFDDVEMRPKPVQSPHPPIYIGGHSPAALRRLARFGNVWHPFRLAPEDIGAARVQVDQALEAAGRRPAEVPVCAKIPLTFQDGPPGASQAPTEGRADDIIDGIRRYVDAGVSEFCFDVAGETLPVALDTLERFSEAVRPRL